MNYDLEYEVDEALAERCITLDAMTDAEIEREYRHQFGRDPEVTSSRFDIIERLLEKLQAEI